jgi:putative chitinase
MFTFQRDRFFADWPARVDLPLTAKRKAAVDYLLSAFEQDQGFTMIREIAYVLATIRWETGHTFLPIKEKRFNRETHPRAWENQNRYWKTGFYGRGYVQLTWEDNYRRAGEQLAGVTLSLDGITVTVTSDTFVENPDYVLDRGIAYAICSDGMQKGWFTGKRLGQYIVDGKPPDYVNARRVINGTDRAQEIAQMAGQFELLLRGSL